MVNENVLRDLGREGTTIVPHSEEMGKVGVKELICGSSKIYILSVPTRGFVALARGCPIKVRYNLVMPIMIMVRWILFSYY